MVPEDKALLAAPNVRTILGYGACGLIGAKGVELVAGARVPDSWTQHSPQSGRVLQFKSKPLPIIQQVLGFHVLNTLTE